MKEISLKHSLRTKMYMRKKLVNILYNLLGFTQKNNVLYFVGVGPTSIATVTEYIQKFNETFINPCPFIYEYMLRIIVLFMFPTFNANNLYTSTPRIYVFNVTPSCGGNGIG